MGMVLLDVEFRAGRAFGIEIPRDWPAQLCGDAGTDATLAQTLEYFLQLCKEQSIEPPADPWRVLIEVIEDASGTDARDLTPETQLVRDIAPHG